MSTKKYRPYFSFAELQSLRLALIETVASGQKNLGLISYLDKFIHEISHELRKPNHILEPNLAERLGMVSADEKEMVLSKDFDPENLLSVYQSNGNTLRGFTLKQITILQNHRYTMDLMTPEEETDYEHAFHTHNLT